MRRLRRVLVFLGLLAIGGVVLYYGIRGLLLGPPLSGSESAISPDGRYSASAAYFIQDHLFTDTERYYVITVSRVRDGALVRCLRIPHTAPESFRSPRSNGPYTPVWNADSNSVSFGTWFYRSDQIDDQIILGDIHAKGA